MREHYNYESGLQCSFRVDGKLRGKKRGEAKMVKIKIEKGERVFYDGRDGACWLTNGQWAVKYLPGQVEILNGDIRAMADTGKSFKYEDGHFNFEEKIPDIKRIFPDKRGYVKIQQTGIAKFHPSTKGKDRHYSIEFAPEDNSFKVYFQEKYADILLGLEEKNIFAVNNHTVAVIWSDDDERFPVALVMPFKA